MTFDTFRLRRKSVFRYPMDPAPRTAVLAACFRQPRLRPNYPVKVFPQGWSQEVSAFAPAAIAAPREQLLGLAAAEQPPVFTHSVIALESPGDPMLSAAERQQLWRAFRVPVFEQIIGRDGELLAAECEAHDGLHIEIPGLPWEGYRVETAPCGCGRKTPRLTPAEPAERARSAAGYAR
ncbi:MAG: hypothetical protein JWO19_1291 [Bryobacterales bacterium]|jgi:hypothetical protein|nr:hypothetical protein [Bryobacterales bacterium]